MVRRIQSCIGFDEDNLEWLRLQEESMADMLNRLVRQERKRQHEESEKTGVPPKTSERLEQLSRDKETEEQQIIAFFMDNPHILYMAKTQRKFTKKDLCKIKDELFFSKYNVETSVDTIKKVLRQELSKFDVKKYEEERGILPKV